MGKKTIILYRKIKYLKKHFLLHRSNNNNFVSMVDKVANGERNVSSYHTLSCSLKYAFVAVSLKKLTVFKLKILTNKFQSPDEPLRQLLIDPLK
jgi:hypothetical protein